MFKPLKNRVSHTLKHEGVGRHRISQEFFEFLVCKPPTELNRESVAAHRHVRAYVPACLIERLLTQKARRLAGCRRALRDLINPTGLSISVQAFSGTLMSD